MAVRRALLVSGQSNSADVESPYRHAVYPVNSLSWYNYICGQVRMDEHGRCLAF